MGTDQFSKAETEYFRLKGMLATGRITKEQFDQSLRQLLIQDAQGRQWILGVDDGKWYVNDGKSWVRADPYPVSAPMAMQMPASMPAAAARTSPFKYVAAALGGVILLCVGVGVGAILATNLGLLRLAPPSASAPAAIPSPLVLIVATPVPLPTIALPATPTLQPTLTATPTPTITPTPTTTPTPTSTLRPQGNCSDPNARWENVVDGQILEPYQAFIGTASAVNFDQYVVEWLRPGNVLHRSATPVIHGSLFVWNTFTVGNGEYDVALIVVLKDGTTLAPCVVRVGVFH